MTTDTIHPQLYNDCYLMGELDACFVLLSKNALIPWFILVPKVNYEPENKAIELFELEQPLLSIVQNEINVLARYVKLSFPNDKLNIATIGNKVKQLHIHIIARSETDHCWPEPVWGQPAFEEYKPEEIKIIRKSLTEHFGKRLSVR